MESVLFIIAQNNFRDEELFEPKEVLEEAGFKCDIASEVKEVCTGMLGSKVDPDLSVKNVNVGKYEAVIVVGGSGSPELGDVEEVIDILQEANKKEKLIASICLGGTVLAKANIVEGKRMTVYWDKDAINLLKQKGAVYTPEDVVIDGNFVTATNPKVAKQFGERIVSVLKQLEVTSR